jgi:hypothetical protein
LETISELKNRKSPGLAGPTTVKAVEQNNKKWKNSYKLKRKPNSANIKIKLKKKENY